MAGTSTGRKSKKSARNQYVRRRPTDRDPILMVSARVQERRADRMHKIGAVALLVVALAGAVWAMIAGVRSLGGYLFKSNPRYTIETLEIESNGRLSTNHIREYGRVHEGMNLFDVNILEVRTLLEEVPLIRYAEVQRLLPDRLLIRVSERTPLARIGAGNRHFPLAVDRDGFVIGPAGRSDAMPTVTGFNDRGLSPGSRIRDHSAMDALTVLELCDSTRLGQVIRIRNIDVSNPDYLEVRLTNNSRVLLPRNTSKLKLEDLARILQSPDYSGQSLDLTVDRNYPAIEESVSG